jgi:hypothetical protein
MNIDPKKVDEVLKKLNGGEVEGDWIAANGFHAMPALKGDDINNLSVINNQGVTVKVFFNVKTGEMRSYVATKLV